MCYILILCLFPTTSGQHDEIQSPCRLINFKYPKNLRAATLMNHELCCMWFWHALPLLPKSNCCLSATHGTIGRCGHGGSCHTDHGASGGEAVAAELRIWCLSGLVKRRNAKI